jgi:hypothetical protein
MENTKGINTKSTPEMFEAFDGGHCYLRVVRDKQNKHLAEVKRWPRLASMEDISALGEWAKSQPKGAI